MYQIRLQHRRGCCHIEGAGTFNRAVDRYASRSSGRAGAAYGAVHRACGSYNGFLSEPVPARKMLWWNEKWPLSVHHSAQTIKNRPTFRRKENKIEPGKSPNRRMNRGNISWARGDQNIQDRPFVNVLVRAWWGDILTKTAFVCV